MKDLLISWLKARLREASTWRGLIAVAGGLGGIALAPELTDALVVIATSIAAGGAINIVRKEQSPAA